MKEQEQQTIAPDRTEAQEPGVIVAGPEAHEREQGGETEEGEPSKERRPDAPDHGVIVAGPEAHEREAKGGASSPDRSG